MHSHGPQASAETRSARKNPRLAAHVPVLLHLVCIFCKIFSNCLNSSGRFRLQFPRNNRALALSFTSAGFSSKRDLPPPSGRAYPLFFGTPFRQITEIAALTLQNSALHRSSCPSPGALGFLTTFLSLSGETATASFLQTHRNRF